MTENYTATKTRSARPGWSMTFRHPLRRDTRGKFGLKIRRGLGTADDAEADQLIAQMNILLSDRRWWSADRRSDAEREFAPQIVSAFFDGIEAGRIDTFALRESRLPLPSRSDGYSRIAFFGTTGAGKTTLLRHLIGSNHRRDRFPSTSTAKTTIADTEIIIADGSYEAAVTFMSEFEVRAHLDECIEKACLASVEGQSDEKIASALLIHTEERFRLSYLLGEWQSEDADVAEAESGLDELDAPADAAFNEEDRVSAEDAAKNQQCLLSYISRIKRMVSEVAIEVEQGLGALDKQINPDDKAAWLDLFSETMLDYEEFSRLTLDIKDNIEIRFELIEFGLERSSTGWPTLWSFKSENRDEFLRQVRWFSGNHFSQFGKLLTPLVDGIRVRGPFKPTNDKLQGFNRLVLIDGQGIGHTAESVSSIPTRVTTRFGDADLILLVDNAQQPLQAAPTALLRTTASAGYANKLAIAFTHFDQVKGDNLRTGIQKRNHVLASIANTTASLRQTLGAPVAVALERQLEQHVFWLGGLDKELEFVQDYYVGELRKLLELMQAAVEPEPPVEVHPIYKANRLESAVRDAVESFLRPWEARLGLVYHPIIHKAHWARVKALNRRIVNGRDYYQDLMPASDLIARLQEKLSDWLNSPADWTRTPENEQEQVAAIDPVRRAVFTDLHGLAKSRLMIERQTDWTKAYSYSGKDSTLLRTDAIWKIYKLAAPSINAMDKEADEFLERIFHIVREAVKNAGGDFKSI